MAPKLSPNPGRTARFYRKNKKSRLKHRRDELKRGKTPAKRAYRRELLKIRRSKKVSPQKDLSHKGGKVVVESRKANRGRGGSQRK
jgi:hypothetical protein